MSAPAPVHPPPNLKAMARRLQNDLCRQPHQMQRPAKDTGWCLRLNACASVLHTAFLHAEVQHPSLGPAVMREHLRTRKLTTS